MLILVGIVFSVSAVRLERKEAPPAARTVDIGRDYVRCYADHFQLYGLGLTLILLGV